jgi:putative zinc finger protein
VTKMVTEQKGGNATDTIRQMIDRRLKTRTADESAAAPTAGHMDEDAIGAFVEGRLEEAEAAPVISHLIGCASCRHATALLIRFESQFESENGPTPIESPGRVHLLLERLAAGITPSLEEDAVFAYQNPEPEPDENAELTERNPGEERDSK